MGGVCHAGESMAFARADRQRAQGPREGEEEALVAERAESIARWGMTVGWIDARIAADRRESGYGR